MNLVALAAAATAVPLGACNPDLRALAGFVEDTKAATGHPSGTAVSVVMDGRIVCEGYFGYADIGARTPVTRNTAFYIASVTKPFFALNTLLKEEAGQLDTRMSLRQMFPDIRFEGIDAGAVSLKDLLVHASGVDNTSLVWATAFSGVHDARSRRTLVAASRPDERAAHGTFKYTNVGYNIASVWLDQRFAMPWQAQLDGAIFQPLGMHHTSASIGEAEAAGWPLARPYSFASMDADEPLYLTKADETMQAAGGLVSTAPDLARFLLAQLSTAEGLTLSRTAIDRSHQPQIASTSRYLDFTRSGYAWGWYTGEYKGRKMLHHFGGFSGFHTHLSFMPEEGIGLVVLNNEDFLAPQLTSLIADYVYGVLLEQPGIESEAARRFAELRTKAREARTATLRQRKAIDARPWNLSHPREDYAGTYSNALLGDMTVELDDDLQMVIRWGRLAAVATGDERRDRVRVEFAPNSGKFLSFVTEAGDVEAIAFEQMVFDKIR